MAIIRHLPVFLHGRDDLEELLDIPGAFAIDWDAVAIIRVAAIACVDYQREVVVAFASAVGCLDAVRVPLATNLVKHLDDAAPGVVLGSTVWESNHSGFRAPDCYFVHYDHL